MHAGDNLYTSAVLALDPDTGKIKTHFQYHQNDSWDWDEVEAPILVNVERDGRPFKSLIHPGRDAIFWILERPIKASSSSPLSRSSTRTPSRASTRRPAGRPTIPSTRRSAARRSASVRRCGAAWIGLPNHTARQTGLSVYSREREHVRCRCWAKRRSPIVGQALARRRARGESEAEATRRSYRRTSGLGSDHRQARLVPPFPSQLFDRCRARAAGWSSPAAPTTGFPRLRCEDR